MNVSVIIPTPNRPIFLQKAVNLVFPHLAGKVNVHVHGSRVCSVLSPKFLNFTR